MVQQGTSFTVPEPVTVADAQPAVFTLNQTGQGQGLVFVATATTSVLADASNPARANDVVVIWCAGLGALAQTVVAGEAAPFSPPSNTVNPGTVIIGGVEAEIPSSSFVLNAARRVHAPVKTHVGERSRLFEKRNAVG